jgi:hypothetical protein
MQSLHIKTSRYSLLASILVVNTGVLLLLLPLCSKAAHLERKLPLQTMQNARSVPIDPVNNMRIREGLNQFGNISTSTAPHTVETSMRQLEAVAQSGNAEAQFILGLSHIEGVKGALGSCPERATYWLQSASMQGNIEATLELARLYETGKLGEVNYSLARYWYEHAANQGSALAQYRLAHMYATGKGVVKDDETASFWLKLSAIHGYSSSSTFPKLVLTDAQMQMVEERLSNWHPKTYQSIEAKLLENPGESATPYGPNLYQSSRSSSTEGFVPTNFGKPLFPWVSNTFFFEKQQRFWDSLLKRDEKE